MGRKYVQRIGILHAARSFADLYTIRSLRLHPLGGEHQGQFALTLHDRWRLIVVPGEGDVVRVEEVTNHYGD